MKQTYDKTDNELDKYDKKLSKLDDYFLDGPTKHEDMQKSAEIAEQMKKKYPKVFSGGVGCFKGTVHIDIQKDAQPYQVPPRHVPIALQKTFKKELDHMVEYGIIEPLRIDECSGWCNSFVAVRKPSGDVHTCINLAKLNHVIIRPDSL